MNFLFSACFSTFRRRVSGAVDGFIIENWYSVGSVPQLHNNGTLCNAIKELLD
jgi:hypothetical protein